jgi:hypothetical protein
VDDHGVLLVSRRGDAELRRVWSWVSRVGVPAYRLDADALDDVDVCVDPDAATVTLNGKRFTPTVTWIRHFTMRGNASGGPSERRLLYRDSWRALVGQLDAVSRAVIGARDPGRLEQHSQATALGIRVPRTVAATDPAAAAAMLGGDRHVVKALDRHYVEPEPGRLAWFHPVILDARELDGDSMFAGAPVVVQEYVPHERELRVYLVGRQVLAFDVEKQSPQDIWLSPENVRVAAVEVPEPVATAVLAFAKVWDLTYAAFDFLVAGAEPVFLEVNPHGDWRWFEQAAGVDRVSAAASRLVCDLHVEGAPAANTDILRFLGAW